MKKRILFVDNDLDFLETRGEELEKASFDLFKAGSIEQAEQILYDHQIHLAIIDLRLRDDSDDRDTSGLTLAKKKAYHSIPKIILTRFPSFEYVREALGPRLNGLPPAVDFLDKREGPKAMIQAVEAAFSQYVRINQDLNIRWGGPLSFFNLTNLIEPGLDNAQIADRAAELEDLFRALFYESGQITLNRLLTQREGQAILEVFAYGDDSMEVQFIVSCGRRDQINDEKARYEKFVPKATGQGGTVRADSRETIRFAATAYNLTGGTLEEMAPLAGVYQRSSSEMIATTLDYLFDQTLAPWHRQGRFRETKRKVDEWVRDWPDLSEVILSPAHLEPRIKAIGTASLAAGLAELDYLPHQLTLNLPHGALNPYPNPLSILSETARAFDSPLLCGTTHGQLNGHNILVDREGRTWLIDFSQTGQGPLLRDFVTLETALKFELMAITNLETRYDIESRLAACAGLNEELDVAGLDSEGQKAMQAVNHIRQRAAAVAGSDLEAYLGGLLFCAFARLAAYDLTVRYTRSELVPYLHSLLSLAILCQRLAPAPRENLPSQALNSLWIDEPNREVWVEGRHLSLSSQELDLLLYLYRHRERLRSRTMIAIHVFGAEFEADMSESEKKRIEEGRINSTVSRLRKKLEPNPDRPRYIISVRGEGYKLTLDN